jgi:BASS family bile acid:Na+ symporter
MFEKLQILDNTPIYFSTEAMLSVNIVLAIVMYGVALGIRPEMFKNILIFPKAILVGLFTQLMVLPAITFLLIVLLNQWITPMVAMGMILVAACPGGIMSNFLSQLSKANIELSVSLTAIGAVITPVLTPFNFWLWGSFYVNMMNNYAGDALQTLYIDYIQMFQTVLLLLGLPLLLGFLTVKHFPKFAQKIKKILRYFSILFFITMAMVVFSNNLDNFWIEVFIYIFSLVFLHNTMILGSGLGLAKLFKKTKKNQRTLTIEAGIQNSGLGLVLLLNPTIFPPDLAIGGMIHVTAWWWIWHIISGLCISFFWSKREPIIRP